MKKKATKRRIKKQPKLKKPGKIYLGRFSELLLSVWCLRPKCPACTGEYATGHTVHVPHFSNVIVDAFDFLKDGKWEKLCRESIK